VFLSAKWTAKTATLADRGRGGGKLARGVGIASRSPIATRHLAISAAIETLHLPDQTLDARGNPLTLAV
jgi:hypothetical protein